MLLSAENKVRLVTKYLVEILIILAGLVLVIIGLWLGEKPAVIIIGIGCSLIAGSIVSLLATIFYARLGKAVEMFGHWGLKNIFRTRQAMNQRCDDTFDPMRDHLDVIAWGLNSFRSSDKAPKVEDKIIRGLQVRMLAPNPDSPFTAQQDHDEGQLEGSTAHTIRELKGWVDGLKDSTKNAKGSIELRFYDFRPQDFYWRQDSHIYVGPYLYGIDSQQTISFEYEAPSRGFDLYSNHFERVWAAAESSSNLRI